MSESKKALCSNCGGEMYMYEEGITLGWKCPDCGWGYCTTSPIISDTESYSVFLNSDNGSADQIKLISSIVNCDHASAKRLIASAPVSVFSGGAVEVREVKRKLESAGLEFSIEPEFPW